MPALNENPFAVLTAVVAPAILTNACSVLCLGTGNRIARVVDQTIIVAAELTSLQTGTPQHQAHVRQLEKLEVRSRFLLSALRGIGLPFFDSSIEKIVDYLAMQVGKGAIQRLLDQKPTASATL